MECSICFETRPHYRLRGCSHSICKECALTMAEQPKHQVHPFGEHVSIPETFVRLECPLCRASEPYPITPKQQQKLNARYPTGYRVWMETELFRGPDGTWCFTSRRKRNVMLFPEYDDNTHDLLDRIEFCSRTTSIWLDDSNMYANPQIFQQWVPHHHVYSYSTPAKQCNRKIK